MKPRRTSSYPYGTKHPSKLRELLHRWWYRKWYARLPEFYRDFYPFDRALSLTLQYAEHTAKSGKEMDELATKSLRGVVDLERTVTELRLALAAAQMGWNEDRVDQFMSTWFGRHDLPQQTGAVQ